MKFRLIMNPGARSGRGRDLWEFLENGLQRAGVEFECAVTDAVGAAFRLSAECNDADTVVAVGGDGTVNEVLDGVIQSGNPRLRMGVFYTGTSPDFCRFHGIPVAPAAALQRLLAGKARQVDVVRLEYYGLQGERITAHCGCGCNIGLGAAVAAYANRWRKRLGDAAGTGAALIRAVLCCPPFDLELQVDGIACSLTQCNNLSILKNPYIASGLKLNLELKPDDGRLLLFGVHGKSRCGLASMLPGFYTGRAADSNAVFTRECTRVKVSAAAPRQIEYDGDAHGFLPLEARLLPQALNLIGGTETDA